MNDRLKNEVFRKFEKEIEEPMFELLDSLGEIPKSHQWSIQTTYGARFDITMSDSTRSKAAPTKTLKFCLNCVHYGGYPKEAHEHICRHPNTADPVTGLPALGLFCVEMRDRADMCSRSASWYEEKNRFTTQQQQTPCNTTRT